MKQIVIFLLAVISLTSATAQTKKESRKVASFNRISFSIPGVAYVRQGEEPGFEIEGPADFLAEVETEVNDGRLSIRREGSWRIWQWRETQSVRVWITVRNLEGLTVNGSGELKAEGKWKLDDLKLNVNGSGSIEINAEAKGILSADLSGSGQIYVSGSCKSYDSDISGSGRITMNLNVYEKADFSITGSGKVEASGTAGIVHAHVSGSGRVLAFELETNKCEVDITGSGDVEISVKDVLNASISGSGMVLYKGNPNHVNVKRLGSGKVQRMS